MEALKLAPLRQPTTIVVTSQKGGVGKTTVSLNLALALAQSKQRTLLIDLDPQGGIGHSLAKGDTELQGLADVLAGTCTVEGALLRTKERFLTLFPRGRLSPLEVCEFETRMRNPGYLQGVIDAVSESFDCVIMDTPAGLGMCTRAAMGVCDYALVPFQAEPLALRSVAQTLEVLDFVRSNENAKLQLLGILPTMVDKTDDVSMTVLSNMWSGFSSVMDTIIPKVDIFSQASQEGVPIAYLGGKPSPEARRFELLAQEVSTIIAESQPKGAEDESRATQRLL